MGEVRGRCTPSIISGLQSTTAIPRVTRCRPDRRSTERWCTAPRTIRTPSAIRLWRQARRALRSFSASLEKFVVPYVVYEKVFSCYTYPGDGKVSFRNIIVECDGKDCTQDVQWEARIKDDNCNMRAHVDSASLPSDSNEISITWDVNARSPY